MNIRDLSHHDTGVKYSAYDGFIVKATEGVNYVDPALDSHIAGIRAAGKPFGLYHFVSISSDPVQQANDFKAQLTRFPDAAFHPMIDSETSCADIVSRTKLLLDNVPNSFLYAYTSFIKEFLGSKFTKYPLWQAEYNPTCESIPGYNRIGWQYQENPDLNNFKEDIFMSTLPKHLQVDICGIKTISIAGWATDPSGVSRIDIYADKKFITTTYTGVSRPDVAAALHSDDAANSGYACDITLSALPQGVKEISVALVPKDGSTAEWKTVKFN
jgi:lysozyme